jgi:hypothetical protein
MTDAMRSVLDEISGQTERDVSPYNVARVSGGAPRARSGVRVLNLALAERNPELIELGTDLVFDGVRADSRFLDLLHRVGWDS